MDLGQCKGTENGMARWTGFEDEASKFPRAVGGDRPSSSVPATRFVIENSNVFAVDTNVNHQDPLFLRQGGGVPSRLDFGSSIGMGQVHHVIRERKERNGEGGKRTHSGDCSAGGDENEDEIGDEDDDDEGDGEVEGLASVDNNGTRNQNNSSGSVQSTSGKICCDREHSQNHNFLLGLRGEDVVDNVGNGRGGMDKQKCQQYRTGPYDGAIATSDSEIYHARISAGQHASTLPRIEAGVENGCRPCGSKAVPASSDFAESLRTHLSDPITGSLMDDAVILFCGHSYGSSGMQHVTRMGACMRCGYPVSGDSVRPNFCEGLLTNFFEVLSSSLRAAVQAFLREEQSHLLKSSRRRRDGLEQGIFNCYDSFHTDDIRGKGVQFPFDVSDRVIIKGNKRTPQRFVGRIAVVTTQCLNGWYVVKTLDNAECVKLQYRSLAKVTDDMMSNKIPLQIGYDVSWKNSNLS